MGGTGSSKSKGYVEALGTNGQWGGVCDDHSFGLNDAHVVCKMLGFPSAKAALDNGDAWRVYGIAPSGSNFVLSQLGCYGSETSIFDCKHPGEWVPGYWEGYSSCSAEEIAGVECAIGKL